MSGITLTALGLAYDERLLARWLADPAPSRIPSGWRELVHYTRTSGRCLRTVAVGALTEIHPSDISAHFSTVRPIVRGDPVAADEAEAAKLWRHIAALMEAERAWLAEGNERIRPRGRGPASTVTEPVACIVGEPPDPTPASTQLRKDALKIFGGGRPGAADLERALRAMRAEFPGDSPHELLSRVVDTYKYAHVIGTDPERTLSFSEGRLPCAGSCSYDFYSRRLHRPPPHDGQRYGRRSG